MQPLNPVTLSGATDNRKIYQVSELARLVKAALENEFGSVWVEGEVSNMRRPTSGHLYFTLKDAEAQLAAVLFLFNLNLVLKRLGAMLPDETLRHETRQFTAFNRWLLVGLVFFAIVVAALVQLPEPSPSIGKILIWVNRASNLLLIFFILLPLAMTMALIWKTKEVILDAVFGARS